MNDEPIQKSPAEEALEIADDNSIDDAVAIRRMLAILIGVTEDNFSVLIDIHDALGLRPDTVKH